jgi:glucose/arabinose dehydrogenase/mono/diheme cytochrome c family protein
VNDLKLLSPHLKIPHRLVLGFNCWFSWVSLLTAQESPAWVSLFNGKDLSGWSLKGDAGKAYVENGEIVCHVTANTKEHTFVCTNDTFADFILEMDVKIDGDFNTGISFRASDALPGAPVKLWSYMVKIDPTPRKWTGGIFEDFGQVWQWLNTLEGNALGREAFKIGAWNRFRLEALGPHIRVWVNGVPTANLVDDRYTSGCIALKIHWTGNFPEREKILAHFKDVRILTTHPEHFARESNLPVTTTVDESGITVPSGFRALLVADDLVGGTNRPGDKLRFLAVGPDSEIYAKSVKGGIIALRDGNGDSRADSIEEFGSGGGTGIALHDGWLYSSTNSAINRYKYTPGSLKPAGEPELIVHGLPAEGAHEAKAFAFDDEGHLLVEVGSPSNGFGTPDRKEGAKGSDPAEFLKTHAGFWRFDANKRGQAFADGFHYATGLRHAVAVAWNPVSKTFFTVMMGRDQLSTVAPQYYDALDNAERVAEELHRVDEGANFGWPFTYYDPVKKARMLSPEYGGDNRLRAESGRYPDPLVAFPAHWAALQMVFYTGTHFPPKYRCGAFIAFHGSWNRAPLPQGGYNVCFVPFDAQGNPTGGYEVFADGFSGQDHPFTDVNDARFRPCGVALGPDGTLYLGDTEKGRLWRIIYTGQPRPVWSRSAATARSGAGQAATILNDSSPGVRLYQTFCATCHMANGGGVPAMQPSLKGSAVVAGEADRLVRVLLEGPAAVLPMDREHYQNVMPAFANLSDGDLAEIINYLRRTFAPKASLVIPAQVAGQRGPHP